MTSEAPLERQPDPSAVATDHMPAEPRSKPVSTRLHIDVLDRRGRLRMRTRIDDLPCVIGRAYTCSLVLDDPFVSAEHVSVLKQGDGRIIVEDMGSANGMCDLESGKTVTTLEVKAGTTIRIGQTLVRFHTADEPVAAAMPLPGVFSTPRWALPLALAAAFGISGLNTYLAMYSKLTVGPFVFGAVALAVVVLCWTGAWALFSRVLRHQSYLAEHCVVFCVFVSLYILAGWVADYYAFAFAADHSATVLEWLLPIGLTAGVLYGHLRFCSTLSSRQLLLRAVGTVGAGAALAGLIVVAESFDPDWTTVASFRGGLKPPLFRVVASADVDAFFSHMEQLKTRVDAVADVHPTKR